MTTAVAATVRFSIGGIEAALAARFGRRHAVLTNRGTTALTAAFHALNRPPGTLALFPAVLCSIPVFAAGFAGWRPAFADVNAVDANFDLEDVERALRESAGRVGAIVPVHMFGKVDNVEALAALGRAHGADLVEDAALSLGAERAGRPAGSFGRVAVLSFVRKMLPLEMGGALLTDERILADRARAFVGSLTPERSSRRGETAAAMKAFHALTGEVSAGDWARRDLLDPFEAEFRRLLLASTAAEDWEDSVVREELEKLDDAAQARRARAEVYETALTHPSLQFLDRTGSCHFAFPVRLAGYSAEGFLAHAEDRGRFFTRIAYPDVSPIFGSRRSFPTAAVLERELIGLPVDDNEPASRFWEYASDFQEAVEDYIRSGPAAFDWRGKLERRMGRPPGPPRRRATDTGRRSR